MPVKIGVDPELFAYNTKGALVPVHEWLPGTKEAPHKVDCGAVQVDGFAAEFNIEPAETAKDFVDNIKTVIGSLRKLAPKDVSLMARPFVAFSKEVWDATPAKYKELGCSPDWDAQGNVLFKEETGKILNTSRVRTGSGHIHIGWGENLIIDDGHLQDCRLVASIFDNYFAAGLIPPQDGRRERYYGLPTAHRPKPYGIELRVPSNLWLCDSSQWGAMFNTIQQIMAAVQDQNVPIAELEFGARKFGMPRWGQTWGAWKEKVA